MGNRRHSGTLGQQQLCSICAHRRERERATEITMLGCPNSTCTWGHMLFGGIRSDHNQHEDPAGRDAEMQRCRDEMHPGKSSPETHRHLLGLLLDLALASALASFCAGRLRGPYVRQWPVASGGSYCAAPQPTAVVPRPWTDCSILVASPPTTLRSVVLSGASWPAIRRLCDRKPILGHIRVSAVACTRAVANHMRLCGV